MTVAALASLTTRGPLLRMSEVRFSVVIDGEVTELRCTGAYTQGVTHDAETGQTKIAAGVIPELVIVLEKP